MTRLHITVAGMAAFFAATPALAATPQISGKYVVQMERFCQDRLTATYTGAPPNGLPIISLANTNAGNSFVGVYSMNFNPGTATVTFNGAQAAGSVLVLNANIHSDQGVAPALSEVAGTWTYANTATTVNLNGTDMSAVYGGKKSGVVQAFRSLGVAGGCVVSLDFRK